MASSPPTIALALQGGGSHGAFTWGVLDRLLQEVAANRLRVAAISGSSAGAINAALTVSGLVAGRSRHRKAEAVRLLARAVASRLPGGQSAVLRRTRSLRRRQPRLVADHHRHGGDRPGRLAIHQPVLRRRARTTARADFSSRRSRCAERGHRAEAVRRGHGCRQQRPGHLHPAGHLHRRAARLRLPADRVQGGHHRRRDLLGRRLSRQSTRWRRCSTTPRI